MIFEYLSPEAKSEKKIEVFREMVMSSAFQIECGKLNYESFLLGKFCELLNLQSKWICSKER